MASSLPVTVPQLSVASTRMVRIAPASWSRPVLVTRVSPSRRRRPVPEVRAYVCPPPESVVRAPTSVPGGMFSSTRLPVRLTTTGRHSYAPMSQAGPWGRAVPR